MVTCSICYDETQEIGELSSCAHRFCYECIFKWSEKENTCPLCKERFIVISRKRLAPDQGHDEEDEGPIKKLRGEVLETKVVTDRKQAWQPEDVLAMDLEHLVCQSCGGSHDDEHMLLCDGCDQGFHTYCVGLGSVIPDGEWHCPGCRPQRSRSTRLAAAARTTSGAAARGRGQGRTQQPGRAPPRVQRRARTRRTRRRRAVHSQSLPRDSEEEDETEEEEEEEGEMPEGSTSDSDLIILSSGDEGAAAAVGTDTERPTRRSRRAARSASGSTRHGAPQEPEDLPLSLEDLPLSELLLRARQGPGRREHVPSAAAAGAVPLGRRAAAGSNARPQGQQQEPGREADAGAGAGAPPGAAGPSSSRQQQGQAPLQGPAVTAASRRTVAQARRFQADALLQWDREVGVPAQDHPHHQEARAQQWEVMRQARGEAAGTSGPAQTGIRAMAGTGAGMTVVAAAAPSRARQNLIAFLRAQQSGGSAPASNGGVATSRTRPVSEEVVNAAWVALGHSRGNNPPHQNQSRGADPRGLAGRQSPGRQPVQHERLTALHPSRTSGTSAAPSSTLPRQPKLPQLTSSSRPRAGPTSSPALPSSQHTTRPLTANRLNAAPLAGAAAAAAAPPRSQPTAATSTQQAASAPISQPGGRLRPQQQQHLDRQAHDSDAAALSAHGFATPCHRLPTSHPQRLSTAGSDLADQEDRLPDRHQEPSSVLDPGPSTSYRHDAHHGHHASDDLSAQHARHDKHYRRRDSHGDARLDGHSKQGKLHHAQHTHPTTHCTGDRGNTTARQHHQGRAEESGVARRELKHQAFAAVKPLLDPLLHSGKISKDQFKAAAQAATHALTDSIQGGELPANALQVSVVVARDAVSEALAELGLGGVSLHD